ncbi:hypothetical protein GCM10025875_35530 [Litorihabitans aurantiacus]|uniref:Amidinotransferase n=1 Tax=Litorihabitans aurantiacus TaxID=1930061 RepID=A0AA37XIS0_9MICO|nr:hypothetical protein GCM10025875_35530 [Litorihabitans aurantiacus]
MTTDVAATTAAPAPATGTVPAAPADGRTATTRRYLMCRPTHFDVVYTINPWMHPEVPVDHELVMSQWETLRRTYLELGHEVEVIEGAPACRTWCSRPTAPRSWTGRRSRSASTTRSAAARLSCTPTGCAPTASR